MISQFVIIAHWYVYDIRTIIDHVSTGYDNIMFFMIIQWHFMISKLIMMS